MLEEEAGNVVGGRAWCGGWSNGCGFASGGDFSMYIERADCVWTYWVVIAFIDENFERVAAGGIGLGGAAVVRGHFGL